MSWNNRLTRKTVQRQQAFTLVELMVVIAIIGLLAGVAAVGVRGYLLSGRKTTARAEIRNMVMALDTFHTIKARYPTEAEGLDILLEPHGDREEGIMDTNFLDPWGNRYDFIVPGPDRRPYLLICYGADGQEGGEGANADITNLDLDNAGVAQ